jgi:hypothetical protein
MKVELEQADSPIHRATINQLTIEKLDAFLDDLRARRLVVVKKLETVAKVKADDAELTLYMRFERANKQANKLLEKLALDEMKAEQLVNKLRVLAMDMGVDA